MKAIAILRRLQANIIITKMTEQEFLENVRSSIIEQGLLEEFGYCDWIEPKRYFIGGIEARMEGLMGFLNSGISAREFSILLPENVENLADINWVALLPPANKTGWIEIVEGEIFINTVSIEQRYI